MKNQSGQALVLVLLSLAVVLTLVLFVLSRSVTDVAISSRQEESIRAFSAAEAGIERALVVGSAGSAQFGDAGSGYSANVSSYAEGTRSFVYPINVASGESATTWFIGHSDNGDLICDVSHPCFTGNSLKICWGKAGTASNTSTTPAVELTVYYESTPGLLSTIKVARAAFDPNSSRRSSNSFTASDSGNCIINGVSYAFQKSIQFSGLGIPAGSYNVSNGLQFARIKLLYNTDTSHEVGIDVTGSSTLPSQGQDIVSTGVAGGSNRRVQVFQGWPEIPSIFEYSVYSSGGLTK